MRQNVQKTIPIHLQPPYKNGAPCLPPPKFSGAPVTIYTMLPAVPCRAGGTRNWRQHGSRARDRATSKSRVKRGPIFANDRDPTPMAPIEGGARKRCAHRHPRSPSAHLFYLEAPVNKLRDALLFLTPVTCSDTPIFTPALFCFLWAVLGKLLRRIDLLIVTRFDRLARSTRNLLSILHQLAYDWLAPPAPRADGSPLSGRLIRRRGLPSRAESQDWKDRLRR